MTTLWFRNARSCLDVCAEEAVTRLTWTRQQLMRYKQDGILLVRQFYMASSVRPTILVIGIQGSSEYNMLGRYDKPDAVYPSWAGKHDDIEELYQYIEEPWGENERKCSDLTIPASLRPVLGQPHKVVIHNGPTVVSGAGKEFWLRISQIQEEYPNVELFVNGATGFSAIFGLRFKEADFGLCDLGDVNQYLILPNGMSIALNRDGHRRLEQWEDWVKVLGFDMKTILNDQKERYRFRIRSARWAAKYWSENYRFHSKQKNVVPDYSEPDATFKPKQERLVLASRKFTLKDANRVLCSRCEIAPGCKLFRQDSICGLGDSQVSDLEKFFQSRNAGLIVDGLARLTQLQARRLEQSMQAEAQQDEVNPEVTKQISSLFANGVKLAKLVDPELNGGPRVQVNVGVNGNSSVQVQQANPKQIMSNIVSALELQGIPREKITPAMVEGVLKAMAEDGDQRKAIEGSAEYARREEMKAAGASTTSAKAFLEQMQMPIPVPVSVIDVEPVNVRDE